MSQAVAPIPDGLHIRATMRLLITGLRTSSVATSGVRDTVRANNNCRDELLRELRDLYADNERRDTATRCKGDVQADAKLILQEDGFVPLTSMYVQLPHLY